MNHLTLLCVGDKHIPLYQNDTSSLFDIKYELFLSYENPKVRKSQFISYRLNVK